MTLRVSVNPKILQWACSRNGHPLEAYISAFPKIEGWYAGEQKPTLKQLEKFAKKTNTPIGCFFLEEPPTDSIPIPDMRTIRNQDISEPSPDLLDTIQACIQRQEWYRDYSISYGNEALKFVGSVSVNSNAVAVAAQIRQQLGFDIEERKNLPTWSEALRRFIELADSAGILVMINGVVGNNTTRKLDPTEFRGFAITDPLAPLIFINGSDAKAAQMFTLAHELAHIWIGESALSNAGITGTSSQSSEVWCNKVAAEILVPLKSLSDEIIEKEEIEDTIIRLTRKFKVSSLVMMRRLFDLKIISKSEFEDLFSAQMAKISTSSRGSGGNFFATLPIRVSKRFAKAIIGSTREGHTLYRDAYRMLGFKKSSTFEDLANSLGVD